MNLLQTDTTEMREFFDGLAADDAAEEIDDGPPPGADIPERLIISGWLSKTADQIAWWCGLCDAWHRKRLSSDTETMTRCAPACMRRLCREITLLPLGPAPKEIGRLIVADKAPDGGEPPTWLNTTDDFRRLFIDEQRLLLEWSREGRPNGQIEEYLKDLLRLRVAYRTLSKDGLERVRRRDLSMAVSHMRWQRMSAAEAAEEIRAEREREFMAAHRQH
jgi:hypothetical protein